MEGINQALIDIRLSLFLQESLKICFKYNELLGLFM